MSVNEYLKIAVRLALRPFKNEPQLWEALHVLEREAAEISNKKAMRTLKETASARLNKCPECGETLRMAEGCRICDNCHWSACG